MDRLAKNAMLAKQAGLSYGKWKALQPRVDIETPAIPEGYKACEYCGKAFESKYKNKRFCDDDCRKAAWSERTRK